MNRYFEKTLKKDSGNQMNFWGSKQGDISQPE
jgi:hypothetical protein